MVEKDLYQILHLSKDASTEDIKKQFKKMAMKCHPDRGGDPEKFKEINEAYAVLSDPQKRQQYDTFGSTSGMNLPTDVSDLFENLFGGMAFPFGANKSSRSSRQKVPPKQLELWVSLEEVYQGLTIPFHVKRKIYKGDSSQMMCPDCKGSGNIVQQIQLGFMVTQTISPCMACSGSGNQTQLLDFQEDNLVVSVHLPMGIPEGQPIIIRDKGDEIPGMDKGDLVFQVRYKKHAVFHVLENSCNLSCSLEISLWDYYHGFKKSIPYLHGKPLTFYHPSQPLSLRLDSTTLTKQIRDYGLKYKNHIGDLILQLIVILPPSLSITPTPNDSEEQLTYDSINLATL